MLVGSTALLASASARAQDLEPRAYANTPVGLNFALAGYSYADGDVVTDPSLPLQDGEVQLHGAVFAYARSLGLFGKSAKVGVVVPYLWASGSATFEGERRERVVDGLGDPRFRLSVNLYGAPALSLEEFAEYEQGLIVGASLLVTAPLGQYDSDKLLNIGTHRWLIKPELGLSKEWWGRLTTELAAAVSFYTDNDRFLGGMTRGQDPLYSLQAHFVYSFRRGFWAALDGTYYAGGRTTVDGVESDDRQSNTRLGATLALPVDRYNSIKLYASTGVSVRTGGDFDSFGIAWQVRWGSGL